MATGPTNISAAPFRATGESSSFEAWSRWWLTGGPALERSAVGRGHDERGVGEEFGVPAGAVEAGGVADVVGLAPLGWTVTAWEPAVAIADCQGIEQVGGHRACGGPVVQDAGASGHEHPVHGGVAEQTLHGRAAQDG